MRHLSLLFVAVLTLAAQPATVGITSVGPAMPAVPASTPSSEIKPEDLGSVEGQVFNAVTGEPLNKASLMLTRSEPTPGMNVPPASFTTTSDATGRFVIRDLEPARYRLRVTRTGFVAMEYGSRGPMRPGTIVTIDRAKNVKALEFRLIPHGVITGRVLDEDGDPQAYVQIQLARTGYMQGRKQLVYMNSASTNDLGEYRMFGVAPGKYVLSATHRPMNMMPNAVDQSPAARQDEDYVPSYYPGTIDPAAAAPIEVTAGATLSGISMKLSKARTARIKGKVSQTIAPGRQMINITVMPRRSDGFAMMMAMNRGRVADAGGNFEVAGVMPGSYLVRAFLNFNGKSYSGVAPVEVGARNIEGLNISIGTGAVITGRVRYEGNAPGSFLNMQLRLMPRDPGMMMSANAAKFNDDGSFRIEDVAPDVYNLNFYGLPDGYYIKSVRSGDQDLLNTGIDTSAPLAPLDVLLSPNAGQLTGVVQNPATQKPAIGATVVLVPQEKERRAVFSWYKMSTTDQHGSFKFQGLTPGEYKVFAWEDIEPGAYSDPDFVRPVESKGEGVTIKEGVASPVQLTLIPAEEPVARQK